MKAKAFLFLIAAAMLMFVGCSNPNNTERNVHPIVGSWKYTNLHDYSMLYYIIYTFNLDGSFNLYIHYFDSNFVQESGSYNINESKIAFIYDSERDDEQRYIEMGEDSSGKYLKFTIGPGTEENARMFYRVK